MVDQWEAGETVPTREQVDMLAALTLKPAEWFYRPAQDWELEPSRTFICDRSRRGENGLTVLETHIDYAGVLHVEQLTPDRPARRERKAKASVPAVAVRPGKCKTHPTEPANRCRCCRSEAIAAKDEEIQ
jgi:hypothetical protein